MIEFRVINKGKVLPQYKGIGGRAKFSGDMVNIVQVDGFKTCVHHELLLDFYDVVDRNEYTVARRQWEEDGLNGRMQ